MPSMTSNFLVLEGVLANKTECVQEGHPGTREVGEKNVYNAVQCTLYLAGTQRCYRTSFAIDHRISIWGVFWYHTVRTPGFHDLRYGYEGNLKY